MPEVHGSETVEVHRPKEGEILNGEIKWLNSKGNGAISTPGYVDTLFTRWMIPDGVVFVQGSKVSYSVGKDHRLADIKVLSVS